MKTRFYLFILAFFLLANLQSCGSMARYDPIAYTQIIDAENEALLLMNLATQDFSKHRKTVSEVQKKIHKAYLYDKNRPKNEITAAMWELMLDPKANLWGGFIEKWKKDGKLSPAFVQEAKIIVQKNFDKIAQLESKKIKP